MTATQLEDFIDEEVVDNRSKTVGVLSCYWEAESGHIYLGVRPEGDDSVHVVPGAGGHLDEVHSIVKLAFPAALIRTAPIFDCDRELRPKLEETANHHFEPFLHEQET